MLHLRLVTVDDTAKIPEEFPENLDAGMLSILSQSYGCNLSICTHRRTLLKFINMQKHIHTFLTESQLAEIKSTFDGMFCVKAGRGLINWLNRLVYVIVKKKRPSLTRLVFVFIRSCYRLYKSNGKKFLVFYLKTLHVQTMQAMGGYVVRDTALISKVRVSKTTKGLPRFIPSEVRKRIREGDKSLLRVVLSLFSLYRVLSFPSVTSLKTIIDSGKKLDDGFLSE